MDIEKIGAALRVLPTTEELMEAEKTFYALQAENEKLRAELEQKEKYYDQMVDALAATDSAELAETKRKLEAAEARAEKAERERDEAIKDISDIFASIDNIRERVGIYNADADDEIAELCTGYCLNAGPMCYKRGESCKCENFKWRGKLEE